MRRSSNRCSSLFFFSSRRRHTRFSRDWSSDVCSSDLNMIDIWYMVIFGVVGYVFKKLDYPLAPLVLALVLGDLAENALRQSLIMSQGSFAIFLTLPIAGAITAVAIFFFVLPVLTPWWRRARGTAVPAPREP